MKDAVWDRAEKALFEFEVLDTTAQYDLYLNIRHGGNYPYRNLYLFTKTKSPSGLLSIDTAQMIFANEQGRWLGKGIGGIYDYQFKFKEKIRFPETGDYVLTLEQAMRTEKIEGVTDVGIRLEKTKQRQSDK